MFFANTFIKLAVTNTCWWVAVFKFRTAVELFSRWCTWFRSTVASLKSRRTKEDSLAPMDGSQTDLQTVVFSRSSTSLSLCTTFSWHFSLGWLRTGTWLTGGWCWEPPETSFALCITVISTAWKITSDHIQPTTPPTSSSGAEQVRAKRISTGRQLRRTESHSSVRLFPRVSTCIHGTVSVCCPGVPRPLAVHPPSVWGKSGPRGAKCGVGWWGGVRPEVWSTQYFSRCWSLSSQKSRGHQNGADPPNQWPQGADPGPPPQPEGRVFSGQPPPETTSTCSDTT